MLRQKYNEVVAEHVGEFALLNELSDDEFLIIIRLVIQRCVCFMV